MIYHLSRATQRTTAIAGKARKLNAMPALSLLLVLCLYGESCRTPYRSNERYYHGRQDSFALGLWDEWLYLYERFDSTGHKPIERHTISRKRQRQEVIQQHQSDSLSVQKQPSPPRAKGLRSLWQRLPLWLGAIASLGILYLAYRGIKRLPPSWRQYLGL